MTDPTTRYPIPDDPGTDPPAVDPPAVDAAPPASSAPADAAPAMVASGAASSPPPPPPPPASRIEAGPSPVAPAWTPPKRDENRWPAIIFGLIILAIGLWFFAEVTLGIDLPRIRWGQLWPLILIGIGALILFGSRLGRSR